ncbi:hypothetical protein C7B61_21215, partial [filamentous cyanobacterium CCP1]
MMHIVRIAYFHFISHLNRKTWIDGRVLLLVPLISYFLPIFAKAFFSHESEQWNHPWWVFPGVPKMWPSFRDLRVITSGYECYRLGYEPRIDNPCDPYVPPMPMNYPKIWLALANLGIDQEQTALIGVIFGFLFFISTLLIIQRINYAEAAVYTLILCSPAVMLGIERGNNDLIIFTFLAASLLILNSQLKKRLLFSSSLILFSAFLKIFPILASVAFIRERRKKFLILFSLVVG